MALGTAASCNTFKLLPLPDTYNIGYRMVLLPPERAVNTKHSEVASAGAGAYWTDGTNVYFSDGNLQYVWDDNAKVWKDKVWNGFAQPYYMNIWTDGTNIYYSSSGGEQYILDTKTSSWLPKTWNGQTALTAQRYWTDGTNIYYSSGKTHFVLNRTTDTWETKTWNGLTSFDGDKVWSDGENIYYSNGKTTEATNHYVLDKSTSTWTTKTWTSDAFEDGYEYIWGERVWTAAGRIYLYGYVLNKETGTWEKKVPAWEGDGDLSPGYYSGIWTDGKNIFKQKGYGSTEVAILAQKEQPMYFRKNGVWTKIATLTDA